MKTRIISFNYQLGYGIGNYGYGLISQMVSSYLIFYGTVILKIPGSLIGLVVSLSILWDAISDPLMGYFSDNTKSFMGRRHIYILIGTILMAATNYFLWTVTPGISVYSKFIWIFTSVMLLKTFITIFITPYNALGAELISDYDGRSTIQAVKTVFFLASILSVTAISMFVFFRPTVQYPVGQLNPDAYKYMAITISTLILITGLITFFSTYKFRGSSTTNLNIGFKEFLRSIKIAFKSNDYRSVALGYLYTNLASALIGTIGLHVFTYTFYMNNYKIGIIFGFQFIVSMISQPFWIKLSKKLDKKDTIMLGLKISIIGSFIMLALVGFRDIVKLHYEIMLIYALVVGFGTSGLFSLPLSMLADTVDLEEFNHGMRNEGVYYGLLNFAYKISQSLAILLFGIVLDLIGFDANLSVQNNYTLVVLGILLPFGSIISFLLAKKAYTNYSLNREILLEIQNKLKSSR
ncbi:MAG: MFS transporter [Clostridiales bacterium]|nr:MFS transporter [Clostridiales bacterium]